MAVTGEGFKGEKVMAYLTVLVSVSTLTLMAVDILGNYRLRKLAMKLNKYQIKEYEEKEMVAARKQQEKEQQNKA